MAANIEGKSLNGYKIRSWGDLVAVSVLLTMLISVVLWGLKLESELNTLRTDYGNRLSRLEARVADGILPRAEERIRSHNTILQNHDRRLEQLEDDDHEHVK